MASKPWHEVACPGCNVPKATHCVDDPAESGGPDRPCPARVAAFFKRAALEMQTRPMVCQSCGWTGAVPADDHWTCPGCEVLHMTMTLTAPVDEVPTMLRAVADNPEALSSHPNHDPDKAYAILQEVEDHDTH